MYIIIVHSVATGNYKMRTRDHLLPANLRMRIPMSAQICYRETAKNRKFGDLAKLRWCMFIIGHFTQSNVNKAPKTVLIW